MQSFVHTPLLVHYYITLVHRADVLSLENYWQDNGLLKETPSTFISLKQFNRVLMYHLNMCYDIIFNSYNCCNKNLPKMHICMGVIRVLLQTPAIVSRHRLKGTTLLYETEHCFVYVKVNEQ